MSTKKSKSKSKSKSKCVYVYSGNSTILVLDNRRWGADSTCTSSPPIPEKFVPQSLSTRRTCHKSSNVDELQVCRHRLGALGEMSKTI